jgi:undecaprenyl-diphosphatase
MEQIFPAAFLGIVQGLTEFLPISSSGHLIVLPKLFGWKGLIDSLSFDVALHLGSSLAVVGFFWRDWLRILGKFFGLLAMDRKNLFANADSKLLLLLIVGSIPAAAVGLLFQDFIETNVRSMLLVGAMLVIFGLILWWVDRAATQKKKFGEVSWYDAVVVGTAQAISLIPGVSRSGITITAARLQNLNRESAVRFSFLLSTPAIVGASLLTFKDWWGAGVSGSSPTFLIGFLAAAASGWLAIKFILAFIQKNNFNIFVIYRIAFGLLLIFWAIS